MKRLAILAFVLLAAGSGTPASAGWGCAAKSARGAMGRAWNSPSRSQAERDALKFCANGHGGRCHVIGCRENVDTQAEAHALWPSSGTVNRCYGKGPCEIGRHD